MATILIVEDERGVREGLLRAVASVGHRGVAATGLAEARAALRAEPVPDCVLLDIRLKDGDGLSLLRELRAEAGTSAPPVIMCTAYGDSERAIEAMKLGAFDYVTKPFELTALLDTVDRAVRQRALATQTAAASPASGPPGEAPAAREGQPAPEGTLIGASAAMLAVWKMIGRAAATDAPVLITGETGTGKELVARAIHLHSPRGGYGGSRPPPGGEGPRTPEPFVAVNLAALPPTLLESELFGHEKGAFTGAAARRVGRIEAAGAGTLFLDEIGDLDAPLQTKLLRVLQDRRFERVGGSESLTNRARVIAATHKPVRPGQTGAVLREDLYYRLAVIEIELPPLRARRSDVPLLVAHALAGTPARAVSEEAMARLQAYHWPGNVRELVHVVQRAAVMCGGEVIDVPDLPPAVRTTDPSVAAGLIGAEAADPFEGMTMREAVAALEKRMIERALARAHGNRAEAARLLGIARPQLYTKMEEHGMSTRRES